MKNGKFYVASLAVLIAASAYPIYMGISTLASYLQTGAVEAANYPKYIIPYTPLCIALIIAVLFIPALYRRFKKYSLLLASLIGALVFFACEIGLEQIKVIEGYETVRIDAWQYGLCAATPQVLQAIGEPVYAQNNPAYKVHFYLIALVIMLSVINVIYGYIRMNAEKEYRRRKIIDIQLICAAIFIGLCIFACFTAFYRTGTISISAVSSMLMSLFFVVFGVTFGVYFACIFYGKRSLLSSALPSVIAVATAAAMYCGELILMDGVLYRYGQGIFFSPLSPLPFAPVDISVMLVPGAITLLITKLLSRNTRAEA